MRAVSSRSRRSRRQSRAGDAAAWRGWYDDHAPGLAAYVAWRCGGLPDLADDVLQETWLTAVRRLRRFDPSTGPFAAWLCGIAANGYGLTELRAATTLDNVRSRAVLARSGFEVVGDSEFGGRPGLAFHRSLADFAVRPSAPAAP